MSFGSTLKTIVATATLTAATSGLAQQTDAAAATAQPSASKIVGVSFVSGGNSTEERRGMRSIAKDYNFKLAFIAGGSGKALGDVNLKVIRVKNGKTVLSGASNGACLFANLPPGNYRVLATRGNAKFDKTVKVGGKQAPGTIFYAGGGRKHKSGCW